MTASYRRKRKEQAQAKAHRQEEENLKWEDEFLELQAELFRHRNRKIARQIDTLAVTHRIMELQKGGVSKKLIKMKPELEDDIATLKREQRAQFLVLSTKYRRMICKVEGLEYLERTFPIFDKISRAVDAIHNSHYLEDLPEAEKVVGETSKGANALAEDALDRWNSKDWPEDEKAFGESSKSAQASGALESRAVDALAISHSLEVRPKDEKDFEETSKSIQPAGNLGVLRKQPLKTAMAAKFNWADDVEEDLLKVKKQVHWDLPQEDTVPISPKQAESLQGSSTTQHVPEEDIIPKSHKQAEGLQGASITQHDPHGNEPLHDVDDDLPKVKKQVHWDLPEEDIIPKSHKQAEDLQGESIPQHDPHGDQPLHEQMTTMFSGSESKDSSPHRSDVMIEEMLKLNLAWQKDWADGLKRIQEDILKFEANARKAWPRGIWVSNHL